jgi:NAD+ kinase
MSSGIRKLLCLVNPASRAGLRAEGDLRKRLSDEGFVLVDGLDGPAGPPDAILLLGGDGFLMETLNRLEYPEVPVFGVNFGTVGFHMNSRACLEALAVTLREGRVRLERYPVLEVRASLEKGEDQLARGFNDVVVERQSRQSIRLGIAIDGEHFNDFAGDGFVIATAAGSTAYNLAAGGPALHPEVDAMVVTPLYPHRAVPFHSVQFSLVLPLRSRIRITAADLPKRTMRVVADGLPLEKVAAVEVCDSGRRISLLRTLDRDLIRTLSKKLIGE